MIMPTKPLNAIRDAIIHEDISPPSMTPKPPKSMAPLYIFSTHQYAKIVHSMGRMAYSPSLFPALHPRNYQDETQQIQEVVMTV